MAIYSIGDIQGCRASLDQLLDLIEFSPKKDHLFLVGDLVNRGPDSVGTLRRVIELGDSASTVLGNHDLNTLAVAHGVREARARDTIDDILSAPDRDDLLKWISRQPLLIQHDKWIFCHAGIYPDWSLKEARDLADEVEAVLRSKNLKAFLSNMYGSKPERWKDDLEGYDKLRFITNAFTRMRYISPKGHLEYKFAGPPGTQLKPYVPWFKFARRKKLPGTVVFGHWSALGIYQGDNVLSLDTGCVWGNQLTAVRLDSDPIQFFGVPCI